MSRVTATVHSAGWLSGRRSTSGTGRRLLGALLIVPLSLAVVPTATAKPPARTVTTSAIVINQGTPTPLADLGPKHGHPPGSSQAAAARTDLDFDLFRTSADRVFAHNFAYTLTTCDGCMSAAVSIQILLSGRGANLLDVGNESLAFNIGCKDCTATSVALQFLVADTRQLGLTGAGRATLADVERQLRDALREDASPDAVMNVSTVAAQRITEVLQSELKTKPVMGKRVHVVHG